jgi:hypothetical protein
MRAWVQRVPPSSPVYVGMEQTVHWFGRRGYEIARFEFDEIARGRLDADLLEAADEMVLRGSVEAVRETLVRANRPAPPHLDLPEALTPWFGRTVRHARLGEIRALVDSPSFEPCHLKPLNRHKLFNGTVVRAFRDLIPTASILDSVEVLVQGIVEFVSEWRAYILRGEIIHVGRYRGDPLLFPDARTMSEALKAFVDRPIAMAMDWGVTADGRTLLVEVNDGYSLGNYGLGGPEYTAMIEARWRELMGLPDNGVGTAHDWV